VEIQYPEYFRVKATTVIPYTCGLTSVDIKNTNSQRARLAWGSAAAAGAMDRRTRASDAWIWPNTPAIAPPSHAESGGGAALV